MAERPPHYGDRIAVDQQEGGGSPAVIYPGNGVAVSILVVAALFVLTQCMRLFRCLGQLGSRWGPMQPLHYRRALV